MALQHTFSHLKATHFTAPSIVGEVSTSGTYLQFDFLSVKSQRLNGTRQGADSAEPAARAI
jgi:hypothetical protein